MPDYGEYFLLRSETIYAVSVGGDVPQEEYLNRAKTVREEIRAQLNQKSIKYNWHEADVTVLEGLLARGRQTLCKKSYRKLMRRAVFFDAWSEFFHYGHWQEAFEETGLDPDFYTMRERTEDERFPWILSMPALINRFC